MKKIISFMSLIFVMTISITYAQEITGPELGGNGPFESPEQRRCPDGKTKTVCVAHDYLGCGDIKGCG